MNRRRLPDRNRPAVINVMAQAAERAGRTILRDFGEVANLQISLKGVGDFVTRTELHAERILHETLMRAQPETGFLMEEGGYIKGKNKKNWIIDPLDGTANFVRSIPHFGISLALEEEGEILAALVFDPVRSETFWAAPGYGAWLNDRRVRVASHRGMAQTLIVAHPLSHPGVELAVRQCGSVRWFGAVALDLAWLAAGRIDAFWQRGLQPWDSAAGVLLVREAGGLATNPEGENFTIKMLELLAAEETLHHRLRTLSCQSELPH